MAMPCRLTKSRRSSLKDQKLADLDTIVKRERKYMQRDAIDGSRKEIAQSC